MAEGEIKLPGVGEVPRKYVMIGGALALGVVGYAWYRARTGASAQADQAASDQYAIDQQMTPDQYNPAPTGDSTTSVDTTATGNDTGAPTTNEDWLSRAISAGAALGYSTTGLQGALSAWLAHQGVTQDQANMINAVRSAVGSDPPQGGPYRVTVVTPPPTTTGKPPAPRLSHKVLSPTSAQLSWTRVPNATHYVVHGRSEAHYGGTWYAGSTPGATSYVVTDTTDTTFVWQGMGAGRVYQAWVYAHGPGGVSKASGSQTWQQPKK